MRTGWVALLLAMVVTLAGCFQVDQVVKLSEDGSGTVEVTTLLSDAVTEMMAGFGDEAKGPDGKEAPKKEPFDEAKLKEDAAKMGDGVEYVSHEKMEKDGFTGVKAVYSFKDITKLKLETTPEMDGGQGDGGDKKEGGTFKFGESAGGNPLLTVVMPKNEKKSEEPASASAQKEPSAEDLAQMKQMFKGLRFGISVEPDGDLVKTNSEFVEGSKVTLFEIDFSALLENDAKLKELQTRKPESLADMKALVKDIPGFKLNLEPEITIEFSGGE